MSRLTEPLGAIHLNSSWVRELASVDLRLSDVPLLGETLSELTSLNTVTNASPVESKPARKGFSESTGTRQRASKTAGDVNRRNSSRSLETQVPEAKRAALRPALSSTPGPAEAVFQLPPQVNASFLRRIAGGINDLARDRSNFVGNTASEGAKKHSARPNEIAERSQQQHELRTLTTSGRSRSRSAVVQHHASVARVGQAELAKRVQRVARRIEASFRRRSLLVHDLSTVTVATGKVLPIDLQSLADHWSMTVAGPGASTEILTRLASSALLPERGSRADVEPPWSDSADSESSAVVAESSPKHQRQTSALSTVHQIRNSENTQQLTSRDMHVRQPWSTPIDDAADHIASENLSQTSEAERWSGLVPTSAQPVSLLIPTTAPAIAPPSLTPSLPPLHSDKQDDVVLPIAAATAQRQARFEEEIARGEDLTLLAQRMERILKQEARRHGIDV